MYSKQLLRVSPYSCLQLGSGANVYQHCQMDKEANEAMHGNMTNEQNHLITKQLPVYTHLKAYYNLSTEHHLYIIHTLLFYILFNNYVVERQ